MKRLIRKAEAINLYHGTNLNNLDNILSEGLKANENEGDDFSKTFFTNDKEKALSYAHTAWEMNGSRLNDCLVILEFALDTDILEPDPDCFNCKNWKDSLNSIGSVSVNGSVLANRIIHIDIYSSNRELLFSGSLSEYNKEEVLEQLNQTDNSKTQENILDQFSSLINQFDYIKDYYFQIIDTINQVNNGQLDSEEGYIVISGIVDELTDEISKVEELVDEYNYDFDISLPSPYYYSEYYEFKNGDEFKAIVFEFGDIEITVQDDKSQIEHKLSNEVRNMILNEFKS